MERITADHAKIPHKASKIVRMITAPHFMAMLLVTLLYIGKGSEAFVDKLHYAEALFTLGLLPMLAYVISGTVRPLKQKGRKFERTLAIIFSVVGYCMGTAFSLIGKGTDMERTLYFTYLLSGLMTAISSFVLKYRVSGHSCGAAGPAAMLTYYLGPTYILLFVLLVPVFTSSIDLRRHSIWQLIVGAIIPIAALACAIMLAKAI